MEAKTVTEQNRLAWLGKQIPNILTVVRIILVPVFIYLFIVATGGYGDPQLGYYYYQLGAVIVFCVAAYTDYLDGLLARRWNLVTNFGKLVDPIADKALMMSSFILLSSYSWLFWWFTILVIFREFAVTFMRFILLRGGKVLPASQGGKLKTLLQCLLVFLLLLEPLLQQYSTNFILGYAWFELLVVVASFVATMVSGFVYFLDSWKDLRDILGDVFQGDKFAAVSGPNTKQEIEPEVLEENPHEETEQAVEAKGEKDEKINIPLWKPLKKVENTSIEDEVELETSSLMNDYVLGEDKNLSAGFIYDQEVAKLCEQDEGEKITPDATNKYPPRRKRKLN